jgi:endonuclease/exonuclease/phosphatase (EEP) superfamily protein YafD
MKKQATSLFQLKKISLAVLAGVSFAGIEAWSKDIEDSESCEKIEPRDSQVQPSTLGSELEIISWNIQKTSNPSWKNDLASLSDSANLVFIQEAVLEADYSASIPANRHREFAPGYRRGELQTGVMTFSENRPTVACDLSIREPWLRTPKATSISQYSLHEREENLLVINLHAVNFAFGIKSYNKQLAALDEYLEAHPGPVILAGDLNTWSEKRLNLVNDFMTSHGLTAVTFEPDNRSKVFGKALDHIYVRGLEAQFAETIKVNSSDHNPLRVRLRFL